MTFITIKSKAIIDTVISWDVKDQPFWKRFPVRSLQVFFAISRDMAGGQMSLQAMSLVYTTLITLVPLLAISFSVLKGFGVHNQIEPFLLNLLEGLGPEKSAEVSEKVITFVNNIDVGVLGAVGFALLIYAVIALMQKIEGAFNYIWRTSQSRTIAQRFSDYLSVLLMGPLLIFLSAGITTTVRHSEVIQQIDQITHLGALFDFFTFLVPWLVMALGFTFVYTYMPNTKVKLKAAFTGALVAAMLWKAMGFVFATLISGSANYEAIYAAFATLIVLMIWLYASWLVVLTGANVAFYVQYPRYIRVSRTELSLPPNLRILIGLGIVEAVGRAHYEGRDPWSIEDLSRHLNAPILAVQKVLQVLIEGKILVEVSNDSPAYIPGVPFDKTSLEQVFEVLEQKGQQGFITGHQMRVSEEIQNLLKSIKANREKEFTGKSIKDALLS